MRLRSLLIMGMVLALLFALALLLGPAIILKFFGLTGTPGESLLAQMIGAGLIAFGLISWFGRDMADPQAMQGTLLPMFLATAVGFVVSLLAVMAKVPKSGNAWIVVILLLAFAVGFAYFQFFGPRE